MAEIRQFRPRPRPPRPTLGPDRAAWLGFAAGVVTTWAASHIPGLGGLAEVLGLGVALGLHAWATRAR